MGKQKKHGAKKFEEYYGKPYKPKEMKINLLKKNFGTHVNCPNCGSFMKVDYERKSGWRQITVKVECVKCGFKEYGLKIDW